MKDAVTIVDLILKLVTLFSIIGGVVILVWRTSRMATRFEMIGDTHTQAITEIKDDIRAMSALMTQVAVQKERLDSQAERLNILDRRYEELRHGEGYVFPLSAHLNKA